MGALGVAAGQGRGLVRSGVQPERQLPSGALSPLSINTDGVIAGDSAAPGRLVPENRLSIFTKGKLDVRIEPNQLTSKNRAIYVATYNHGSKPMFAHLFAH